MIRTYTRKNKLSLRKCHFFVTEQHIEDVKQDQKIVPDLVESIMKPADPVKAELRRILFKTNQYRPKIEEFRDCTFWMSGKIPDSPRRQPAGAM